MVNRVGLPAIHVDARADVSQAHTVDQRQDLSRLTGAPTAQERPTPALKRMPLHPVGVWTVDADLGESNGAGSERVARDRGLPQAVRCDGDGHSASLSGMANQYLYLNARAKALRTSQADAPLI